MAFFAHIGGDNTVTSSLGYSTYPTIPVTGVLDTIFSDLSSAAALGTNNGWTVYDDLRASGSISLTSSVEYAFRVPVIGDLGVIGSSFIGSGNSFTFTSASTTASCSNTYGWSFRYCISSISGSGSAVTFDGTKWYSMNYNTGTSTATTEYASLDTPYISATTYNSYIYEHVDQHLVLQCVGSQKTFYVHLAVPNDRVGGATLFMRAWETWDNTAHVGTNPSSWERTFTGYLSSNFSSNLSGTNCQAMFWFLQDAFAIWTSGIPMQPVIAFSSSGNTSFSASNLSDWRYAQTLSYVGMLDTSAVRTLDSDALIFIPGNLNLSGKGISTNLIFNVTTPATSIAGLEMLRTIQGEVWNGTPTTYNVQSQFVRNAYQIFPQSSFYGEQCDRYQLDLDGYFEATNIDVHQMANEGQGPGTAGQASEGRRGVLKWVKAPVSNPSGMHLGTILMDDGRLWMLVRQSPYLNLLPAGYAPPWWSDYGFWTMGGGGSWQGIFTGWAWSGVGVGGNTFIGEEAYSNQNNGGCWLNYVMLPVSGANI